MDKSDVLLGIIDDRCRKALKEANIPSKIVGTVVKVDSKNKKIDVKIAGYDTVFTLLNKSGEILSEGDNVFVESIKDNLTNGYISERFGEARWIESNGLPEGGSTGQVLAKKSNNNNDTEWVDQTTVVNNLNSDSTTDALSAKQGKILNDKITDTGWVNLTLSNGWENLGGNYPPAQYRKIGKQVFLRGLIKNNSSNTTRLLNLDSSIKPLKTNYTIVTESDVVKAAYVEASGTVNIVSYTKGNWVNLGNISYFID